MNLQEWAIRTGLKRIGLVLAGIVFVLGLITGAVALWFV
jgi:hypothetical protein